jgi:hypothetical protein
MNATLNYESVSNGPHEKCAMDLNFLPMSNAKRVASTADNRPRRTLAAELNNHVSNIGWQNCPGFAGKKFGTLDRPIAADSRHGKRRGSSA